MVWQTLLFSCFPMCGFQKCFKNVFGSVFTCNSLISNLIKILPFTSIFVYPGGKVSVDKPKPRYKV